MPGRNRTQQVRESRAWGNFETRTRTLTLSWRMRIIRRLDRNVGIMDDVDHAYLDGREMIGTCWAGALTFSLGTKLARGNLGCGLDVPYRSIHRFVWMFGRAVSRGGDWVREISGGGRFWDTPASRTPGWSISAACMMQNGLYEGAPHGRVELVDSERIVARGQNFCQRARADSRNLDKQRAGGNARDRTHGIRRITEYTTNSEL